MYLVVIIFCNYSLRILNYYHRLHRHYNLFIGVIQLLASYEMDTLC